MAKTEALGIPKTKHRDRSARPTSRIRSLRAPDRLAATVAIGYGLIAFIWTYVEHIHLRADSSQWMSAVTRHIGFLLATDVVLFYVVREGAAKLESAELAAAEAKLEIFHRLALVAEWKDDTLGGHNYRVARYCEIVGKEMGLSPAECELLFHGAMLHDIGKVGVPDSLLKKRGRLTSDEMHCLRQHAEVGARLLDGTDDPLIRTARSMAHTHHERWNGTGYPRGLREYDIPVEGRITAVCDVLDALLSERHYKEAWSMKSAMEYLTERSGMEFDPVVVAAAQRSVYALTAVRDEVPTVPWLPHPPSALDIEWERMPLE